MKPEDLKKYVIQPTLIELGLYSNAAVKLILGTCAQESGMGYYLHQLKGCALGIYQMEPATLDDIFINYAPSKPSLFAKIFKMSFNIDQVEIPSLMGNKHWFIHHADSFASICFSPDFLREALIYNLKFATAMCRVHYLRVSEALPASNDIQGLAKYWKKYYNTVKGKGSASGFIRNYIRLGLHEA